MQSQMSKQYQTTVPSKVRKELGVKPGNQLNWKVSTNKIGIKYAVIVPETDNNFLTLQGVAKDMYENNKNYLKDERNSWN